jgi:hypothetical protein
MTGEIPWKDRDIVSLLVSIEDTSIDKLTSNFPPRIQEVLNMCLQLRPGEKVDSACAQFRRIHDGGLTVNSFSGLFRKENSSKPSSEVTLDDGGAWN